jgi:aspartyl-tRNA synthetase
MQKRTNYCGELDINNVGQQVVIYGWLQKQRDIGSLFFIDVRDRRRHIARLYSRKDVKKNILICAYTLRSEFEVCVNEQCVSAAIKT